MKKKLLLSIASLAVLAVGLTACNDPTASSSTTPPVTDSTSVEDSSVVQDSSSESSSSEESTSTPDSSSSSVEESTSSLNDAITVSVNNSNVSVQVGQSVTVRATVMGASVSTVTFTIEDDSVATVNAQANGISATITGASVGTTKIIVASVENPTKTAEINVEVSAALPTLKEAWANISALQNYTFTVNATTSAYSGVTQIIRRTEKAIIVTSPNAEGTGEVPMWTLTTTGNYVYGYGVTPDNDVISIEAKQDLDTGAYTFVTPATIFNSGMGFLNETNFDLTGASSPNSYGNAVVYGLGAINTEWFPTTKEWSNVYEVNGDSSEAGNISFVESSLWQLMDYTGWVAHLRTLGNNAYFYNIAGGVETSIEVIGSADVRITLTTSDGTFVGTLSAVGETEQIVTDSTGATVENYLNTVATEMPALATNMQAAKKTMTEYVDNMVQHVVDTVTLNGVDVETHNYTYLTPNYIYYDYDDNYIAYQANYGYRFQDSGLWMSETGDVYSFFVESDGSIRWNSTPSYSAEMLKQVTGLETLTMASVFSNYFGNNYIWSDSSAFLYNFDNYEYTVWQGDTKTYSYTYTDDLSLASELGVALGVFSDEDEISDYYGSIAAIAGMGVTLDTTDRTYASEVRFTLGWTPNERGFYVYNTYFDSFGAATTNDVDDKLAANNPDTPETPEEGDDSSSTAPGEGDSSSEGPGDSSSSEPAPDSSSEAPVEGDSSSEEEEPVEP